MEGLPEYGVVGIGDCPPVEHSGHKVEEAHLCLGVTDISEKIIANISAFFKFLDIEKLN